MSNMIELVPITAQSGDRYRDRSEAPIAGPGLTSPTLTPYSYVEEEYFASGDVDGKPYRTLLLVRKPKDPAKFSGVVAVETLHLQGTCPFWPFYKDTVMSGGHGWVMVVSQREPLEMFVKKSNAARYASLQIPEAVGDAGNLIAPGPQDVISRQIMTQIGALLKKNDGDAPFAGMSVQHLIMGGVSQTGLHALRYIREAHPKARMPDGKPVYDGYFPSEAFLPTQSSGGDAAVIQVIGEGDFGLFRRLGLTLDHASAAHRDSEAPSDRYRVYQFPASSHVPTRGMTDPKRVLGPSGGLKPGEQLSQFPLLAFYRTAFINLIDWIATGIAPPKAPPIEILHGEIVRDQFGNAKGGVRTPYVELPTARYIAMAPMAEGDNPLRSMIGLQEPFSSERLRSLYQSRADYLKRFDQEMERMVSERWLLPKDGQTLKAEEAKIPEF
jgi:hypothetical protein